MASTPRADQDVAHSEKGRALPALASPFCLLLSDPVVTSCVLLRPNDDLVRSLPEPTPASALRQAVLLAELPVVLLSLLDVRDEWRELLVGRFDRLCDFCKKA